MHAVHSDAEGKPFLIFLQLMVRQTVTVTMSAAERKKRLICNWTVTDQI